MTIISTKELDIYLERSSPREYGQIFYIGGTGGDLRNRPNQLDSPLTEFFEVISYDQRGLGQTSKPSGDYSMQQYADDAADILDELNIKKYLLWASLLEAWLLKSLLRDIPTR